MIPAQVLLAPGVEPPGRGKGEEMGVKKIKRGLGLAVAEVQDHEHHYLCHPQCISYCE